MIGFVAGAAVGYVLGTRAGRERYEQIVQTYRRIAEHPAVQSAAGVAREKVTSTIRPNRNGRSVVSRPAVAPTVSSVAKV